jgi:hypothetical protein
LFADTLAGLERALERVHGEVRQLRIEALANNTGFGANDTAPMVPEARAGALRAKLEPLLAELLRIRLALQSIDSALDFRERRALRLPREFRWRERQSVASTRAREGALYQRLCDIIDELLDLWGNQMPSEREVADAVVDAVKSHIEQADDLIKAARELRAIIEAPDGPVIRAHQPVTVQNVSWDSLVLVAWLLMHLLIRLKRR